MNNALMFGSAKEAWETPQAFFDAVNRVYRFDLDVCALPESAKCKRYFTPDDDALQQKWIGKCWMNPPYGKGITGNWTTHAAEQAERYGSTVVSLLPARTDTKWFHDAMTHNPAVMFIKGRLKFGDATAPAPFPSCLVVFSPRKEIEEFMLLKLSDEIAGWVA